MRLICLIDERIQRQINTLLHHTKFQILEASWRGLYLLCQNNSYNNVYTKILDYSLLALSQDLSHAIDFNQSAIFQKIYSEEFDHPGGLPFGLLIGDYHFQHKATTYCRDPIQLLTHLAQICFAAYTPFVSSLSPNFFGLNSLCELQKPINLIQLFTGREYTRWQRLKKNPHSQSLGFVLPSFQIRLPYQSIKINKLVFTEHCLVGKHLLFANAAYLYAISATQHFGQTGWFNDFYGRNRMFEILSHDVDQPKLSTEIYLTDKLSKALEQLKLITLNTRPYQGKHYFQSNHSIYEQHRELNYYLCLCRIAHYIKVIIRNKIGLALTPKQCEQMLHKWLIQYCATDHDDQTTHNMKYPLISAKVEVTIHPSRANYYLCRLMIQPRGHFTHINTTISITPMIEKGHLA